MSTSFLAPMFPLISEVIVMTRGSFLLPCKMTIPPPLHTIRTPTTYKHLPRFTAPILRSTCTAPLQRLARYQRLLPARTQPQRMLLRLLENLYALIVTIPLHI
jgi:hypothetical protein